MHETPNKTKEKLMWKLCVIICALFIPNIFFILQIIYITGIFLLEKKEGRLNKGLILYDIPNNIMTNV